MFLVAVGTSLSGFAATITEAPPISEVFVSPLPTETAEGYISQGERFDFRDQRHIRIEGEIEEGDVEALRKLLGGFERWNDVLVTLNSTGGDYKAGLALSDTLRANNIRTMVGPGDTCLSACALAFLGGRREFLRGIVWTPERYVHVTANLGFHAPFNTVYPAASGLTDAGAELIAELYYGQAREAIRELQARIQDWQVLPDLIFDLLGKGPDEFFRIERAREIFRNQITVIADRIDRPRQITGMEAYQACAFVLAARIEPATGYQDSVSLREGEINLSSSVYMRNPNREISFAVEIVELGQGNANITVNITIPGRGPFKCWVHMEDGLWRLEASGDFPLIQAHQGNVPNIADAPYALNTHSVLGPFIAWTVAGEADLRVDGPPLFGAIPTEYRVEGGPSFSCDGDLDPAAEIICRYPTLARADKIMVEIYKKLRSAGVPEVRKAQIEWIRDRNAFCRVTNVDRSLAVSEMMAGYCLLSETMRQINALLKMSKN